MSKNPSKNPIVNLVLRFYEGEPCRICGETITDASKAVYAGYSKDSKSRAAHKEWWDKNIPQKDWVHQ